MEHMPYLGDRGEVKDAAELILLFGDDAGYEAASRAGHESQVACQFRGFGTGRGTRR